MKQGMKRVRDIQLSRITSFLGLIESLRDEWGFTASKVASAFDIMRDMLTDDCVIFLSFPACLVATGFRGILNYLLANKYVDIVITTGGSIDHDIARTYTSYYRGAFEVDDRELQRRGIHRLGNVFIPIQNYGPLIEEFTKNFLRMLRESGVVNPSASELIYHLGLAIGDENSFLYQAAKSKIPVFSPGILDSSFGTNFSLYSKDYGIRLDLVKDMNKLLSLSFDINKSGAIILGGGISKHHTIWWNQFKGGLDYAIYITTAVEWDGSLSGARTREAISWGKINTKARHVTVEGDVTVIFPILMVGLNELNIKRNGKNLCDILGIS